MCYQNNNAPPPTRRATARGRRRGTRSSAQSREQCRLCLGVNSAAQRRVELEDAADTRQSRAVRQNISIDIPFFVAFRFVVEYSRPS